MNDKRSKKYKLNIKGNRNRIKKLINKRKSELLFVCFYLIFYNYYYCKYVI